jgi:ATP-dependent Clp protease ATP-binding subunit ClpA
MFERFTDRARQVVVLAQQAARDRSDDGIGSEHLLLAVFRVPENLGLTVLTAFSVTEDAVLAELDRGGGLGEADAERLATLGIDLDEVRRRVEESFGAGALDNTRAAGGRRKRPTGHIPFTREAKKVMELSLREAIRMRHNYIGVEHIVLGMLHDGTGPAGEVLARRAPRPGADATGVAAGIFAGRNARLEAARVIVEELLRGKRAG